VFGCMSSFWSHHRSGEFNSIFRSADRMPITMMTLVVDRNDGGVLPNARILAGWIAEIQAQWSLPFGGSLSPNRSDRAVTRSILVSNVAHSFKFDSLP
jgi:hypothetical protein